MVFEPFPFSCELLSWFDLFAILLVDDVNTGWFEFYPAVVKIFVLELTISLLLVLIVDNFDYVDFNCDLGRSSFGITDVLVPIWLSLTILLEASATPSTNIPHNFFPNI